MFKIFNGSDIVYFKYMHRNFLLVFFILELIISTCISAFACKGTCETDSTVVNVSLNQVNNVIEIYYL